MANNKSKHPVSSNRRSRDQELLYEIEELKGIVREVREASSLQFVIENGIASISDQLEPLRQISPPWPDAEKLPPAFDKIVEQLGAFNLQFRDIAQKIEARLNAVQKIRDELARPPENT